MNRTASDDLKPLGDLEKGNASGDQHAADDEAANAAASTATPAFHPAWPQPNSPRYTALQATQFDQIITNLETVQKELMKAPWYSPKGKDGVSFPKGSEDGWIATLFVTRGRAFHLFVWPWLLCTINAVVWTTVTNSQKLNWDPYSGETADNYRTAFQLGLSATLSFLLVFRLNRSILRFWEAMKAWGHIVSSSQALISSVLIHGSEGAITKDGRKDVVIPHERDQVIVWTVATAIAAKNSLRKEEVNTKKAFCKKVKNKDPQELLLSANDLVGLLSANEIRDMNNAYNAPLYAANEARYHIKVLLDVKQDYGSFGPARSGEMRQLEKFLDFIILNVENAENIQQTPLPLVYVAHLRLFLMVYLLALPYLTAHLWGWATIPIVSMTAALMLGVEGASAEVESPFQKGKVNDLNLDKYCEILVRDTQQLVKRNNERNSERIKKAS